MARTTRVDTYPLDLKEEIIRYILTQILTDRYRPGAFLSEAGVAKEFSEATGRKGTAAVSRAPVREAFLELASAGFLISYPQQGTQIRKLDDGDVIDLWKSRQFLEELVAVELSRQDEVPLTEAEEVNAEMEKIAAEAARRPEKLTAARREEFVRLDSELHARLAELAGLGEFAKTLQRIRRLILLSSPMPDVYPAEMQKVTEEHRAIFKAIRPGERLSGDPEEAKKRVRAHLANSAERWKVPTKIKTQLPELFQPTRDRPSVPQVMADRSYIETRVALDLAAGDGSLAPAQEVAGEMNDILRAASVPGVTEAEMGALKTAFKSHDLHFHLALVQASRHAYLQEPLGYLWHLMFNDDRFPRTNPDPVAHMRAVVNEHRQILTAIGLAQLNDEPEKKATLATEAADAVLTHLAEAFMRWQKYDDELARYGAPEKVHVAVLRLAAPSSAGDSARL